MREEVRWFAERMEEVLRENDHRGGWKDMSALELFSCFLGEVYELDSALWHGDGDVVKECCDVANYAMMIADKVRRKKRVVDEGREDGDQFLRCSFCGKPSAEVEYLVAGPNVYICNTCVRVCQAIVDEERMKKDV